MKKRLFSMAILIAMLSLIFGSVTAQSYSFSVPTATTELYINSDGTATIRYSYTFQNEPGAPPIEYIDVGLPTSEFSLDNVNASINGSSITSISYADPQYIPDAQGVTLALGTLAIPPGESGTVTLSIFNLTGLLYTADEPEDYASFLFMPNYFGSEYTKGSTNYTMYIFMPPGLGNNEPRYFPAEKWPGTDEPTEIGITDTGRIYYMWNSSEADTHSKYRFGGAFPKQYVPEGTLVAPPTFLEKLGAFIDNALNVVVPICFGSLFIIGPIGLGILGSKQQKKRKLKYLPPKVRIEGHGIKRGLTAVQAAILLEKPMDSIITMILFSTIRKGAAEVIKEDPLKIKVIEPLPKTLYPYEKNFLTAMKESRVTSQRRMLQNSMAKLVKAVKEKMKGFSYKETVAYYEDIVERAWKQVENADTPEVAMENFDKYMPWTMLDDENERRTREVFTPMRPVFMPIWWSRYRPSYRPTSTGTSTPSTGSSIRPFSGGRSSMPSLPGADFAAGLVLGTQSFATNTIGNLTSFTEKITNKTNPIPKPTSSGRSGGGGSSCACACAGCACACAGGGR
ncbi:MAG: hypothetical protein J7K85_09760 [Anaerolineaceae bacterium]|nr:hypothetical protein [Anaerolineaceae bacterium]